MNVTCTQESDLTEAQRQEILDLQHAAFPKVAQFARQRWWHTKLSPQELWFMARDDDGRLIGSVRVVPRRIATGAGDLDVAGAGNVCSHPAARGSGAASACMRAFVERLAEGLADYGVLFCGPDLRAFYEKFSWRVADNEIEYVDAQGGSRKRSDPNRKGHMMIHAGRRPADDWPEGLIDINGPDW